MQKTDTLPHIPARVRLFGNPRIKELSAAYGACVSDALSESFDLLRKEEKSLALTPFRSFLFSFNFIYLLLPLEIYSAACSETLLLSVTRKNFLSATVFAIPICPSAVG